MAEDKNERWTKRACELDPILDPGDLRTHVAFLHMEAAVRAVLSKHGMDALADEIVAILEQEHLGSSLDVSDAVGHLLGDGHTTTL